MMCLPSLLGFFSTPCKEVYILVHIETMISALFSPLKVNFLYQELSSIFSGLNTLAVTRMSEATSDTSDILDTFRAINGDDRL